MYEEPIPDQWLSLSEASAILGVHASTLRRWADSGRVPCQRTPGGHRRFNRRKLMQMIEGTSVSGVTDIEPGQASEQAWYTGFAKAGLVEDLRVICQRLSGITVQFLLRSDDGERLLHEGKSLGRKIAVTSRRAGIGKIDALHAYLFYRSSHVDLLGQMPSTEPTPTSRLYARFEYFMGQVLLSFMEEYLAD